MQQSFFEVEGRDGSASTLCSGCVLLAAIAGKFGPLRPAVTVVAPKLAVAMGDCGIKSGGAVIEVPMLVHPPFTAATFVGVARGTGR